MGMVLIPPLTKRKLHMANRNFNDVQTLPKGVKVLAGSFAPNGSSAVSSASVKGLGFTVARTGTGVFTLTLQDAYVDYLGGSLTLALNAADDKYLQFGAIDVVTAKTVVINVWDISGAALTDVAANANNRIHFVLWLKNSTV
jgi:hypothetical protein